MHRPYKTGKSEFKDGLSPRLISILILTEEKESTVVSLLASFPANSRSQCGLYWGITWVIKTVLSPLIPSRDARFCREPWVSAFQKPLGVSSV